MKKIVSICIITIILLSTLILISNNKSNKNTNITIEKYDINEIVEKINIDTIDTNFLNWIKENYKEEAIININNYLKENSYNESIWYTYTNNTLNSLNLLYNNKNIKIINTDNEATISFVGDVNLADDWYIMPKYNERNKGIYGILSEDVVKIMNNSDFLIANSEFSISNRGSKMAGKTYTFRSKPENLNIYKEMGIDLVTLANNHVFDYGEDAFLDTLTYLDEYNIPHIGAGKNIDEASKPYYIVINGYTISFVNATRAEKYILTPVATDTNPGVFRCYDTNKLVETIKEAKQNSDYVIVLPHWGREDSHELEQVIIDTSKEYIEAGADVIVGTHAHVLQGIEFYNNKPIIYNLGDFIFGKDSIDTGIFKIILDKSGNMEYYFIPCYESDEYTKLLYDNEKQRVINEMINWSINANIDKDGKITES